MSFEIPQGPEFQPEAERKEAQKETVAESHRQMEKLIKELRDASPNNREKSPDGREAIMTPEGEKFFISLLEKPNDPRVKKLHSFMIENFGKEESEALYWLRESIKQKLNYYHVLENEKGEIISFSNTQYLELEPVSADKPREQIVVVWHIATADAYKRKGLASELYQGFYKVFLDKAKKEDHAIRAVMGETVSTVESFLNRMGRKRMYFEDKQGNIHEVPYFCPPVDMDSDTGKPTDPPMPEHVMVRMVDDSKSTDVQTIVRIVKAMYKEYVATEEDYNSREAFQKAWDYDMNLLAELEKKVSDSKDGKIFFMSAAERKNKIKELHRKGKELFEVNTEESDGE